MREPTMESVRNVEPGNPEKERGELAVVPIFRGNDLYQAMFPEVEPVFEKGENRDDSSAKKVLDAMIANPNKTVLLDKTCDSYLSYYLTLENLPKKFELTELPLVNNAFDKKALAKLLKIHYNIDYNPWGTIDAKLEGKLGHAFSPELVKGLFEIAKKKNEDMQKVYILTLHIADHTPKQEVLNLKEYEDLAEEISRTITYTNGWDTEEAKKQISLVSAVLRETAEKELGIKPELIATVNMEDIQKGDFFVVDRHHPAVSKGNINERFPQQVLLLPLETELLNNEKFLGNKFPGEGLAMMLRRDFEKPRT